jgi:effector-binding domain-containing protein
MKFPCEITEQTAQPALSIRFRSAVQDLPQHFSRVYAQLNEYVADLGEIHEGPVFAAYHNFDMQDLDVEAGFVMRRTLPGKGEIQPSQTLGGTFAICHYTGPYNAMQPAYESLMQFIKEQGYYIDGPTYEWYIDGPEAEAPRTDLAVPVQPLEEILPA